MTRAAVPLQRNLVWNPIRPTPERKQHRRDSRQVRQELRLRASPSIPPASRKRSAPKRFPVPCRSRTVAAEAARTARPEAVATPSMCDLI